MLFAHLQNGFVIEIKLHPKKNKTKKNSYDLYLMFIITQNGLPLGSTEFSIGMACPVDQWGSPTTLLKGKSPFAKATNTTLKSYENNSKVLIERVASQKTADDWKMCIQTHIRTEITGRATRGAKKAVAEKVKEATLCNVIDQITTTLRRGEKPLGKCRKQLYRSVYEVLCRYFNEKVPTLRSITKQQMRDFKDWYYQTYNHKPETRSTYLGVISAIFRFAVDELELILFSPIPKGFAPVVKKKDRKERRILEDAEIRRLYGLTEDTLRPDEMLAKTIMTLQVCTGMAYCDLVSLQRCHVRYNHVTCEWIVRKQRMKSGEYFTVALSAKAKVAYDKLCLIASGGEGMFHLPKLREVNKLYNRLARRAGVERFTSYDLRHSFSVHFMDHGGKIEDLAEALGHVKLETSRIYAQISDRRRSQVMKNIAQSIIHQL